MLSKLLEFLKDKYGALSLRELVGIWAFVLLLVVTIAYQFYKLDFSDEKYWALVMLVSSCIIGYSIERRF
jgi:DMSO/TMAO reductase YedYZ heme-binding membrane subunit